MTQTQFQTSSATDERVATVVFLLAGGQGSRLSELTAAICKSAIHVGGSTRLIDYIMANIVISRLTALIVTTQYRVRSLESHLGSAWAPYFSGGHLAICKGSSVAVATGGYADTADAPRRATILA